MGVSTMARKALRLAARENGYASRFAADARLADARRLLAGFDRAVDAIAAPALVLAFTGEILHGNASAQMLHASDRDAVQRSLAAAGPDGAPPRGWDVTPLVGRGRVVGVLAIMRRPSPLQVSPAETPTPASRRWKLTSRQTEVLELVGRGLTNDLIADTLGIGIGTVEFHLSGIFDRAGVSNRATLLVRMLELGRG